MNQSLTSTGPEGEVEALDVKTVAASLGVSRATVLRWINAKKLEGFFRIGHKWLIRKSDLDKFIGHKVSEQSSK